MGLCCVIIILISGNQAVCLFCLYQHRVCVLLRVDCICMLGIKLGIHGHSLKHGIYLAEHYLNQHEVTLCRHSTGQLCGNVMTGAISVDSSRRTRQRKQHVAAFVGTQHQLAQHAVTWSQKTNKCDTISYL